MESLRVFLEQRLGTQLFLKIYQTMDGLQSDAGGDAAAEAELAKLLPGGDLEPALQLVHQLLVCEDSMALANQQAAQQPGGRR